MIWFFLGLILFGIFFHKIFIDLFFIVVLTALGLFLWMFG